ncbi:hypothetical protein B0T22DRAFT_539643 [Podospora appendiculata]|uniref:Uncharacterized protein n=1 Tax=Podospora appendiculata TaxID=314037 RepID=A0AAE1C8C1_9PEZI|nr:hypothetical protein B0T22DRAFT_539643 [Podospora appendiculata]
MTLADAPDRRSPGNAYWWRPDADFAAASPSSSYLTSIGIGIGIGISISISIGSGSGSGSGNSGNGTRQGRGGHKQNLLETATALPEVGVTMASFAPSTLMMRKRCEHIQIESRKRASPAQRRFRPCDRHLQAAWTRTTDISQVGLTGGRATWRTVWDSDALLLLLLLLPTATAIAASILSLLPAARSHRSIILLLQTTLRGASSILYGGPGPGGGSGTLGRTALCPQIWKVNVLTAIIVPFVKSHPRKLRGPSGGGVEGVEGVEGPIGIWDLQTDG